jgi:hypothetical integral membrane protein (TIGR02206 family)
MPTFIHLAGPAHLVILGAIPFLAGILAVVQRRLLHGSRWLRVGAGITLILDSAIWYGYLALHGQLAFPDGLPLELCDATLCLVVIELFTLNPAVFDIAYYTALAGTTMALLTPDLWESFPSFETVQFFIAHGMVVTATLYLVWSGLARPRRGSVGKAMLAANIFAALVGTFDFIFKTNYMYLRAKPESVSLLSFLGSWPWYIAASEGVALVLFLLLYLPFRRSALDGSK